MLERLDGTNTSLLQKVVTYGHKKFYNIGPWDQFNKEFYDCKLCSTLVKRSRFMRAASWATAFLFCAQTLLRHNLTYTRKSFLLD